MHCIKSLEFDQLAGIDKFQIHVLKRDLCMLLSASWENVWPDWGSDKLHFGKGESELRSANKKGDMI